MRVEWGEGRRKEEEEEAGCCMPGAAAVLTWGIRRKKRGGRRHALTHTHTLIRPSTPLIRSLTPELGILGRGRSTHCFFLLLFGSGRRPRFFMLQGRKRKKQLFPTSPPARSDKPSFVPRVIDSEGSEEDRESMSPPPFHKISRAVSDTAVLSVFNEKSPRLEPCMHFFRGEI